MFQALHGFKSKAGIVILFLFTGTCTVLLFREFSPPDAPWLPYAALVLFEYGLWQWMGFHKNEADGTWQHAISFLMVFLSGLAIAACTGVYLWKLLIDRGMLASYPWIQGAAYVFLIAAVPVNVLAHIGVALTDPQHLARLSDLESPIKRKPIVRIVEAEPSNKIAATSNKFDELDTGEMVAASLKTNGQIKKKVAQGGATQTTP